MIMSIITIILMVIMCVWSMSFNARYCFRFLASKFYTTAELSDEFRAQFVEQLADCSLPCKRLVSSRLGKILGGMSDIEDHDTRPIIYAAREIYINEDICRKFSPAGFAAGLAYEEAHYYSSYYGYLTLVTFIIFAGCMPLVFLLNTILQSLVIYRQAGIALSALAYVINLLYVWPLLQFIVVMCGMTALEFAMGKSVVNLYAKNGYDLESLLRYLKYVESHATVGLNQLFNITSNRQYCEKLFKK